MLSALMMLTASYSVLSYRPASLSRKIQRFRSTSKNAISTVPAISVMYTMRVRVTRSRFANRRIFFIPRPPFCG